MKTQKAKKLHLAFLWHMHQPYYKDDTQNEYKMPWVFLHAIKDYYELPNYLAKFDGIKATFNLVPSLLEQLEEYQNGFVNDTFLSILKKDASILTAEEKEYLCDALFFSNLKTMIRPFPRYLELYTKKNSFKEKKEFAASLDESELIDLEVLFLLSWCSNALREESKIVSSLINKAKRYDAYDKDMLLKELFSFVAKIIPFYASLQKQGKIEIATTPFYHPILPLLLDKNAAKEADRNAITPKIFADFGDDATRHVEQAISKYESLFGKKPMTFWPAEGSISNEALSLLSRHGVLYVGADEDVLFKSLESKYRFNIYKKYTVGKEHKIGVLFRDKALSDLIGFAYSGKKPQEAAEDFILRLSEIHNSINFEAVVPIILDGENAWEYYDNNAKEFFQHLYEMIEKTEWCDTMTFSEVFSENTIEAASLESIRPGSWIYGTFSTWMGHEEKNRAWELLSDAKIAFESSKSELSDKEIEAARKELMIAEGSDWFWWYGDDHYTPLASQFDELFRKHLLIVYKIIGKEPPPKLYEAINKTKTTKIRQKPKNYIKPDIDGRITDFYEWLGAGSMDLSAELSTMDSSGFCFEKLYWGFDDENIYFAIVGKFLELIDKGYDLHIELVGTKAVSLTLPFSSKRRVVECVEGEETKGFIESAVADVFEVSIPKSYLECGCDMLLQASFEIRKNSKIVERAPHYGSFELEVNEKFLEDWYI